jgi:formylglycine-generating enzyme required for sulfatase activity
VSFNFLRTTLVAITWALLTPPVFAADPTAPFRDCPDCPEMQRVPAGTFLMGTPGTPAEGDARAESQATVIRIARPFAIGRTEITQHEFRVFLLDSSHEQRGDCVVWDEEKSRFSTDPASSSKEGDNAQLSADLPAFCLSWQDARAYVQWLAKKTGKPYRLPSEAEWEYVARAGAVTLWPWGDAAADGCDFANTYDLNGRERYALGWDAVCCHDGYAEVAPVGALRPNAFGLYDLIGNVAEWVDDCYTDSYVGRPKDGRSWFWSGGCRRHVVRGGSWASPAAQTRSATRTPVDAAFRSQTVGMRVALDLDGRAEGR